MLHFILRYISKPRYHYLDIAAFALVGQMAATQYSHQKAAIVLLCFFVGGVLENVYKDKS